MKNERERGIRTPFPDAVNCPCSFTRKRDMSTRLNKLARGPIDHTCTSKKRDAPVTN